MISPLALVILANSVISRQTANSVGRQSLATATPAQVAAESVRVRTFAWAAAVDRSGATNMAALGDGEAHRFPIQDGPKLRAYRVGEITVWVDVVSGLVMASAGGPDHALDRPGRQRTDERGRPGTFAVQRLVSDEQALAIASRAYTATGRFHEIKAYDVTARDGSNGDDIGINFLPTYRGVPFGERYQGKVAIDRETGQVDRFFVTRETPPPPASVVPGVSADEAHLTALRAAAAAGVPVEDYPDIYDLLSIQLLDNRPDPTASYSFTPADHADAVAGRTRLVYDVRVYNARQGPKAIYIVLVDAHDGHLMQVSAPRYLTFGSSSETTPPGPFAPPAEVRPWRVSENGSAWSAPVFTTLVSAPADGFAPTRKLLLTDGRVAFPASLDPATGRIGLDGPDGKPSVYALGPALAARLRTAPTR